MNICPKAESRFPDPGNQWGKSFYRQNWERGLHVEIAQSALSHLQIGLQWSDQCHLDGFMYS